jgi:homotetrameric cytidine deaminase
MKNDIWEALNNKAKEIQGYTEWSPFATGGNVACALETESGKIFSGINIETCCGAVCLCAERVALTKMVTETNEVVVKRLLARNELEPIQNLNNWSPCGACREFLLELSDKNRETEIMVNFETRKSIKLKELLPYWWGDKRYNKKEQE